MTAAPLCTCPVEVSGFQVHHPHCGHPSWFEDDLMDGATVDAFILTPQQTDQGKQVGRRL